MRPIPAANQLTKVWRQVAPENDPYPVNCRTIAKFLNIEVGSAKFTEKFEASLVIEPDMTSIVYNEQIREPGRINFSIAHELGHASCHQDQKELYCSISDLVNMKVNPHAQEIEQEANLFAATLLMPSDDFRKQIDGQSPSLELMGKLADGRYGTTLTATTLRLLTLSQSKPLAMIWLKNGKVAGSTRTREMVYASKFPAKGTALPNDALAECRNGRSIDSRIWLRPEYAERWELSQSCVHMPYYDRTLILLEGQRIAGSRSWAEDEDEYDPTPPSMPSFRR